MELLLNLRKATITDKLNAVVTILKTIDTDEYTITLEDVKLMVEDYTINGHKDDVAFVDKLEALNHLLDILTKVYIVRTLLNESNEAVGFLDVDNN